MIVKAHEDGSFYVADNGNWRLAGPFPSNNDAWAWVRQHRPDHAVEPTNPKQPRMHIRQPRAVTQVTKGDVFRLAPIIARSPSSTVGEREFALRMEMKANRPRDLKLTQKQAGWWIGLMRKYGSA